MKKLIVAIALGAVLAFVCSRLLFVGSAFSLVPWGIAGLLVGVVATTTREAVLDGAVYGFVLSFLFMTFGYSGAPSLLSRVPFFALLGAFGAVCGMILAVIGQLGRRFSRQFNR